MRLINHHDKTIVSNILSWILQTELIIAERLTVDSSMKSLQHLFFLSYHFLVSNDNWLNQNPKKDIIWNIMSITLACRMNNSTKIDRQLFILRWIIVLGLIVIPRNCTVLIVCLHQDWYFHFRRKKVLQLLRVVLLQHSLIWIKSL